MAKMIMAAGQISVVAVVPMTTVETEPTRETNAAKEIMAVGTITIEEVATTMEDKTSISISMVVGEDVVAATIIVEEEVVVAASTIEADVGGEGAVAVDAPVSCESSVQFCRTTS